MVFERIKAYLVNKKLEEKERQNWYIVKKEDDSVIHIIDEKMLEIILVDWNSLEELVSCGWTSSLGWHSGNDNKIYERHTLNHAGLDYYNLLETRLNIKETGHKYVKLLNEINDSILPDKTDGLRTYMYWRICSNFKINHIKGITKYNGEELKEENQNVAVLS